MNEQFQYKLEREEYLEYLRAMSSHSKQFRGRKLLLMSSIPTLIVCTLLYFEWYRNGLYLILGIVLLIFWIGYAVPQIWMFIMNHRINENILSNMNVKGFEEIIVGFHEKGIIDPNGNLIPYNKIKLVLPLKRILVIGYTQQQAILLPYRIFFDEEHLNRFLRSIKHKIKDKNKA